jgi:DNA-binding NarL/FixJ family response regulator
MSIKVAIVEDDADIRSSLMDLLRDSGTLTLTDACRDGADALKRLPQNPPDVVIMDINMPGMNGVECVRQLKALLPAVNVLMLTVYEDSDWLFESLKAGASGYLLKRTSSKRLLQAINEVHAGGSPMTPQIARRVVRFFAAPPAPLPPPAPANPAPSPAQSPATGAELPGLTAGQRECLELLAAGYAYKEIADKLGISIDGVRSYVRKIYEKLHVHSRTEAVVKFLNR